jgi:acyl carrier protein
LPRDLADRLLPRGEALWNLYGPTETTIWSSSARIEAGDGPITIGRPILNTQMYVLDQNLQPVPIGVVGELYIGGAGVARGYLGRPGLTAERFVPDPFGKARGGRLYRTGDLARRRLDGRLECLGRVDHQVKVRGFRIELGEIEVALRKHPAVREAVVVAREDGTGEKSLVAYLVSDPPAPTPSELRPFLKDSLPDYMIPSSYVALEALPLTPNGKVDRDALPAPEPARPAASAGYVPPRGPVEEAVAGIWGELLACDRVGVHDNFFELGGHSLIATQLLARLRDVFAVEPSLRDFLDAPTVAGLSRLIERELAAGAGLQTPPIERADRDGPLPASFPQQRLWFLDQLEPGSAGTTSRPPYGLPANSMSRRSRPRSTRSSAGTRSSARRSRPRWACRSRSSGGPPRCRCRSMTSQASLKRTERPRHVG